MPLVQGLAHQIHLFLVEYNRCNHLPSNLPGYRPRGTAASASPGGNGTGSAKSGVPEEILHQQRLLLQSCDRLKLSVSRHQNNNAQNTGDVVDVIRQLGATLTKLIELMLSKEIKVSLGSLSRPCFVVQASFNGEPSSTRWLYSSRLKDISFCFEIIPAS